MQRSHRGGLRGTTGPTTPAPPQAVRRTLLARPGGRRRPGPQPSAPVQVSCRLHRPSRPINVGGGHRFSSYFEGVRRGRVRWVPVGSTESVSHRSRVEQITTGNRRSPECHGRRTVGQSRGQVVGRDDGTLGQCDFIQWSPVSELRFCFSTRPPSFSISDVGLKSLLDKVQGGSVLSNLCVRWRR